MSFFSAFLSLFLAVGSLTLTPAHAGLWGHSSKVLTRDSAEKMQLRLNTLNRNRTEAYSGVLKDYRAQYQDPKTKAFLSFPQFNSQYQELINAVKQEWKSIPLQGKLSQQLDALEKPFQFFEKNAKDQESIRNGRLFTYLDDEKSGFVYAKERIPAVHRLQNELNSLLEAQNGCFGAISRTWSRLRGRTPLLERKEPLSQRSLIRFAIENKNSTLALQSLVQTQKKLNQKALNKRDPQDGLTALMVAVNERDLPSVKVLVDAGVDLEVKNNQSKTALDLALSNSLDPQSKRIALYLLGRGAKIHSRISVPDRFLSRVKSAQNTLWIGDPFDGSSQSLSTRLKSYLPKTWFTRKPKPNTQIRNLIVTDANLRISSSSPNDIDLLISMFPNVENLSITSRFIRNKDIQKLRTKLPKLRHLAISTGRAKGSLEKENRNDGQAVLASPSLQVQLNDAELAESADEAKAPVQRADTSKLPPYEVKTGVRFFDAWSRDVEIPSRVAHYTRGPKNPPQHKPILKKPQDLRNIAQFFSLTNLHKDLDQAREEFARLRTLGLSPNAHFSDFFALKPSNAPAKPLLLHAVETDDDIAVQVLLENGANASLTEPQMPDAFVKKENALTLAARKGMFHLLPFFVTNKANLNASGEGYKTALYWAAKHKNLPAYVYLLVNGAKRDQEVGNNQSAISTIYRKLKLPHEAKFSEALIETSRNMDPGELRQLDAAAKAEMNAFLLPYLQEATDSPLTPESVQEQMDIVFRKNQRRLRTQKRMLARMRLQAHSKHQHEQLHPDFKQKLQAIAEGGESEPNLETPPSSHHYSLAVERVRMHRQRQAEEAKALRAQEEEKAREEAERAAEQGITANGTVILSSGTIVLANDTMILSGTPSQPDQGADETP